MHFLHILGQCVVSIELACIISLHAIYIAHYKFSDSRNMHKYPIQSFSWFDHLSYGLFDFFPLMCT